jgi:hypothetical protein
MLFVVGLGLGDAEDITVKGLEAVRKADRVILEAYTSILTIGREALVIFRSDIYFFVLFNEAPHDCNIKYYSHLLFLYFLFLTLTFIFLGPTPTCARLSFVCCTTYL